MQQQQYLLVIDNIADNAAKKGVSFEKRYKSLESFLGENESRFCFLGMNCKPYGANLIPTGFWSWKRWYRALLDDATKEKLKKEKLVDEIYKLVKD